jgi:hypothetical protein
MAQDRLVANLLIVSGCGRSTLTLQRRIELLRISSAVAATAPGDFLLFDQLPTAFPEEFLPRARRKEQQARNPLAQTHQIVSHGSGRPAGGHNPLGISVTR